MRKLICGLGAGLVATVVLTACAPPPPPPPPEPTIAQLTVRAEDTANAAADGTGRPSAVYIYALQPGAPFETVDRAALFGEAGSVLPETIKSLGRQVVVPGKELKRVFELPDGTQSIGVAVDFRAFETAAWRVSAPVTPNQVTLVKMAIGSNAVTVE